jgi:hypothetical protein
MPGARWALGGAVAGLVASLAAWAIDGFPARDLVLVPMMPLMLAGFALMLHGRTQFIVRCKPGEARRAAASMVPGALLVALGAGLYVLVR